MTSSVLYPLRVRGHVDPATSRWLWLVKWLLVIPHLLTLAALWIAVVVTTLIAGFAILFTGRYPRPLFDFPAGGLRWPWGLSFSSPDAFPPARHPPFSLRPDPTYPAELEVAY